VSLKELALHLNLSPTTVSVVLNSSALANTIPQQTKERIFEAARQLQYRPNFIARSLRAQRTFSVGVLLPELSGGYSAMVLSGVEERLMDADFFYFVASHHHREDLIERYTQLFVERCVEGLLAIDTPQREQSLLPVVSISGHDHTPGVTNIALNHDTAARLALSHLLELGHRRIAVIKGQSFSSDTEIRWQAIAKAAQGLGVNIQPQLVIQLQGNIPSPEPGYAATQQLLQTGEPFTAIFAFNDISAIGAIGALRAAGRRVPEDVSVIGFDDIDAAAFHNPALTTVRQPLKEMGHRAADILLQKIARANGQEFPAFVNVEPDLIIRQSTAHARKE
jgi:LacI family transcriptional regulator